MYKRQKNKSQSNYAKLRAETMNLKITLQENPQIQIQDHNSQISSLNNPMISINNRNRCVLPQQNVQSSRTCWKYITFLVIIIFPLIYFLLSKGLLQHQQIIIEHPIRQQFIKAQLQPIFKKPIRNLSFIPTSQKINITEFVLNQSVWMFKKISSNYLHKLMAANNQRFASLSNFKVNLLSQTDYDIFLSKEGNQKVQQTIMALKKKINKGDQILNKSLDLIQKRLILFTILFEKGGVIIDGPLTLTENFDWIRQIQSNIYVNRGNNDAKPQVVGFYSPLYSSEIRKQNKSLLKGMEDVDRCMVLIPAIQGYFVAAQKRAEFIGRVLDEMIAVLLSPESVAKDIAEKKYNHYGYDGHDVYSQYLFLAAQRVLQSKQRELDTHNATKDIRNFAIDYYGLSLINSYYGPQKLSIIFMHSKKSDMRKIQNIAKYDLQEYVSSVGPMRYLQISTIFNKLNSFLTQIRNNKMKKQIMRGSYLQQMYFPEATQPFIFNNPEKWVVNHNFPRWDSLAKIIWTFYDTGLASAPFQTALFVENLKKKSSSSGFEFREVNDSNLAKYIDAVAIQKIEFTLKNAKHIYPTTKANLIRLALIYKYGGVYLDVSVIAVENFDWLVDIAAFPSQYIFNRYGDLPSVLMFWNPNNGGFFQWEVDEVANTKQQWRYSFENSIIIASKGSEFIKEWFDLLSQNLMKTIPQVLKVFEQCNISSFKWITEENNYLVAMDSAKCVIGRRQSWITKQNQTEWKNSMAYYGIWGFSSFLGPFKIRFNMNLATLKVLKENPFFTRYSQEYVEGIIGKMNFIVKFTKESRRIIPNFIKRNFATLQKETHSKSLFRKYFYNPNEGKFQKINSTKIVWIKKGK